MNLGNITLFHCMNFILFESIFILGIFTKKPYSKPLESHVVYNQKGTAGQATSVTSKINHGPQQSDWTLVLYRR